MDNSETKEEIIRSMLVHAREIQTRCNKEEETHIFSKELGEFLTMRN